MFATSVLMKMAQKPIVIHEIWRSDMIVDFTLSLGRMICLLDPRDPIRVKTPNMVYSRFDYVKEFCGFAHAFFNVK